MSKWEQSVLGCSSTQSWWQLPLTCITPTHSHVCGTGNQPNIGFLAKTKINPSNHQPYQLTNYIQLLLLHINHSRPLFPCKVFFFRRENPRLGQSLFVSRYGHKATWPQAEVLKTVKFGEHQTWDELVFQERWRQQHTTRGYATYWKPAYWNVYRYHEKFSGFGGTHVHEPPHMVNRH